MKNLVCFVTVGFVTMAFMVGCQTTPAPVKTTKTTTTEAVQQQEVEAQYVEVSADKLANFAFAEDFKNKYVIFDAFGFPATSAYGWGKYEKDSVLVIAQTNANNLGQTIFLLIPKAQSDLAFALTPLQPIRVYGKFVAVVQGRSVVEVKKMEVRSDQAAGHQGTNAHRFREQGHEDTRVQR